MSATVGYRTGDALVGTHSFGDLTEFTVETHVTPSCDAYLTPVCSLHVFSVKVPSCLENLPMEQVVHGTDPCVSLYFPVSHSTHTELPDVIEYVGAPQSLHRDDDVDFLYFPAVHLIHDPPSGPEEPTFQVQLIKTHLPTDELEFVGQVMHVEIVVNTVEYVPTPQSVQFADPVDDGYFPVTNTVHVSPSGPV